MEKYKDSSIFRYTVDVESDWGGRTDEHKGIEEGLPKIIETFKKYNIQGLFFISTELSSDYPYRLIEDLRLLGHEVGSHGHFHTRFKEGFRRQADKDLSLQYVGKEAHYRAPKFSHITEDIYSNPKGHVGLLKHMWLKTPIPPDPIFYLHPFDIVGGDNPHNLFCRMWYSKPEKALLLLKKLLEKYPGETRLT